MHIFNVLTRAASCAQSCARETGWCLHELISGKKIINVIRHICCVQDLSHIASLESLLCMSDALGEVLTSVCGREVAGVCSRVHA
jgi:hypothetical protein